VPQWFTTKVISITSPSSVVAILQQPCTQKRFGPNGDLFIQKKTINAILAVVTNFAAKPLLCAAEVTHQ
jgi:hypothetical protein